MTTRNKMDNALRLTLRQKRQTPFSVRYFVFACDPVHMNNKIR